MGLGMIIDRQVMGVYSEDASAKRPDKFEDLATCTLCVLPSSCASCALQLGSYLFRAKRTGNISISQHESRSSGAEYPDVEGQEAHQEP